MRDVLGVIAIAVSRTMVSYRNPPVLLLLQLKEENSTVPLSYCRYLDFWRNQEPSRFSARDPSRLLGPDDADGGWGRGGWRGWCSVCSKEEGASSAHRGHGRVYGIHTHFERQQQSSSPISADTEALRYNRYDLGAKRAYCGLNLCSAFLNSFDREKKWKRTWSTSITATTNISIQLQTKLWLKCA